MKEYCVHIFLFFSVSFCNSEINTHAYQRLIESNLQDDALDQLRNFVMENPHQEFMTSDPYLRRLLYAQDYDIEATKDKFRKGLAYRAKHGFDGIMKESFPNFVQSDFPLQILSFDNDGRPVGFVPAGKYSFRKMVLKGHTRAMHRAGAMLLESMEIYFHELHCKGNLSQNVSAQLTAVIDLAGVSMLNFACFNCLTHVPDFITILNDVYTGIMHRIIFVNVPRLLVSILVSLFAFMPPKDREVIDFFGYDKSEWKEVLLGIIPFDQLLIKYGGGLDATPTTQMVDTVFNWNNPTLDNIVHQYRNNETFSNGRKCHNGEMILSKSESSIGEMQNGFDLNHQSQHPHRHSHGLNHERQNSATKYTEPANSKPESFSTDLKVKPLSHEEESFPPRQIKVDSAEHHRFDDLEFNFDSSEESSDEDSSSEETSDQRLNAEIVQSPQTRLNKHKIPVTNSAEGNTMNSKSIKAAEKNLERADASNNSIEDRDESSSSESRESETDLSGSDTQEHDLVETFRRNIYKELNLQINETKFQKREEPESANAVNSRISTQNSSFKLNPGLNCAIFSILLILAIWNL